MADIGVLTGVAKLSAAASNDVEKVEFIVDGNLAFTAYAQPFDFVADTATLANGDHNITVNAVNSAGISTVYNTAFKVNNVNPYAGTLKILSPADGETVSGKITVVVEASVKTGLRHLCTDVDGGYLSSCIDFPLPYPTSGKFNLTVNTLAWDDKWASFPGTHKLGAYTYGTPTEPLWIGDSIYVNVVNTPPPPPANLVVTDHRATRTGNYFTIDVTVKNVGGDIATDVVVKDNLIMFQPILSSSSLYEVSTDLGGYNLATQNAIIKGKVDIPPDMSVDYAFDAVPVLAYPGGAYPYIGNAEIELTWNSPRQSWPGTSSVALPVVKTTSGELLGQAYNSATKMSDYLIVTSPENLMRFNAKEDVAKLLSKMAELARLKDGVLGYLDLASSLTMTYKPHDGFAVADVAGDSKAEMIVGDQDPKGGEIHVYGLQSDVPPSLSAGGPPPPVEWREYAHFTCGQFALGDKIAVGDVLGEARKQIVVAHGTGAISLCEDWTPNLLTPIAPGSFVFGPIIATVSEFKADYQPFDGLAVGDVNGDGKDEIVVASAGNDKILVYAASGALLSQFSFTYNAGDGLAVGNVLGDAKKQIVVASAVAQTVFILSDMGSMLSSFPKPLHWGDELAVGKPVVSWNDDKDEIVFADDFSNMVTVWEQGAAGWAEIQSSSRLVQPFYGLSVGNVFGGQGDDIVIADWKEKSIDFQRLSEAGTKHILHSLIQASYGSWAAKLRSDWTSQGYLLIVGETEIVPAYGGKTFGQAYMVTGWEELRADVTDYPYASTSGEEIRPELSIGRIIGNNAIELIKPIQTSIEAAKKTPGYGFNALTMFPVSGFPGAPPNNIDFQSEMVGVAQTLRSKGLDGLVMINTDYAQYDAQGKFDKTATDNIIIPKFFANTPDKDVIFLAGHGNSGSWDAIKASDVLARPAPFGSTNPFVFASSCMTGMYFIPGSFAEAFLQRGAGAYLGAINWGKGSGDWIAKALFEKWNVQQEPVGLAVKKVKQSIGDQDGDYWSAIYQVYGDPKFPVIASNYVSTPGSPVTAGAYATAIQVPDYLVTQLKGVDQVTIPGGQSLAVPGLPEVPSYRVFYDVPKGLQVQDVTLQSRSDPLQATGLNLPNTSMGAVGQSGSNADSPSQAGLVDWWPKRLFDWSVIEGPDSNTLTITVYPLDYNPLTTDAKFYKNYAFTISSSASSIELSGVTTGKESYSQGEPVTVSLALENKGNESKDVIVSTAVRDEGTREAVGGLPLRTLKNLKGKSSYSGTWNSTGMPPGYYSAMVELRDTNGTLLDRKTKTFRLDAPAGEITQFSAAPRPFNVGDIVALTITFKNTGTQNISGLAVVKVLDASRKPVATFSHDFTNLTPPNSAAFSDSWNTAGAAAGAYAVTGFVYYDGKTSQAAELSLESNTPHADAGPDQTVERSDPGGANVTLDGSKSYSPVGLPLTYQWNWTGGFASAMSPTVSLPMGNTLVTLTVSDGAATATDTVNIRVVDSTPPKVQIRIPASGESVQDGLRITADASDLSGVAGLYFWIREPLGLKGASLGYDAAAGTLKSVSAGSGTWEYLFDSTKLADGYYVVMAKAIDNNGNEAWSQVVPFSIRNSTVLNLNPMLPSTPDSQAGRTMPVKFALYIPPNVDPARPFVHNEQLTIKISGGSQVLQTSVYGSTSTDYRIEDRLYITNFRTLKSPMQYTVDVQRKGLLIGSFNFATTK
ncbi:MAG TPA: Ig-like domain-containing protein [Acidobacteriota bacterium]|nr:Ig-like domain-containing protein [Acidobacteriota bacterium]